MSAEELEELMQELQEEMGELAQEQELELMEMIQTVNTDMDPQELEQLKKKHRADEMREIVEADIIILPAHQLPAQIHRLGLGAGQNLPRISGLFVTAWNIGLSGLYFCNNEPILIEKPENAGNHVNYPVPKINLSDIVFVHQERPVAAVEPSVQLFFDFFDLPQEFHLAVTFIYKLEALDFILKDNPEELGKRVYECILKANQRFASANNKVHANFSVKVNEKIFTIDYEKYRPTSSVSFTLSRMTWGSSETQHSSMSTDVLCH